MIEILNGIHEIINYKNVSGLNGIRLYHNTETEDYPIHWHIALEIITPIKNTYTVQINNETIICNEKDIILIPPGELHSLIAPQKGERLILQVDSSLLGKLNKLDSFLSLIQPYKLIRYEVNPELSNELGTYLSSIEEEYFMLHPFVESSIYSLLLRFFVTIGRTHLNTYPKFPTSTPSKQYEYIEKFMDICKYITNHCTESITVDDLAVQAGFSKFHFSRLFKQFTGMSCYDYLISQRITYAEQLLLTPSISITEVAMQSGFNSLSTFNRIFKAYKKCTPTEYKRLGLHNHSYDYV